MRCLSLIVLLLGSPVLADELPVHRLVMAMIEQESAGGRYLYNPKENAHGVLQIRQSCLDDVNAYCRTAYTLQAVHGSQALSVWAFYRYCERWNAVSLEDRARLWNGGPTLRHSAATLPYWRALQRRLGTREQGG